MKTGAVGEGMVLHPRDSWLASVGPAAGPGGAPAAAQRRGRTTWTCEGPAAGSPAAGSAGSRAYRAGGDRPGGWRAGLISLSPPRGEDQVGLWFPRNRGGSLCRVSVERGGLVVD